MPLPKGIPEMVAVPSPLSWKVTPDGSGPDCVMAGVGCAGVVVTVKVPKTPEVKVAWSGLVKLGVGGGGGPPPVPMPICTCATLESSVPLLALYSKVSTCADEPSLV